MKAVTIYGTQTSSYQYFKYHLKNELERLGIDVGINEINNIRQIVDDKIESIPSIKIGEGRILSYDDSVPINGFLQKSVRAVMEEYNSRKMKKILVPFDFSSNATTALNYAKAMVNNYNAQITIRHYKHPSLSDTKMLDEEKLSTLEKLASTDGAVHGRSIDQNRSTSSRIKYDIKNGLAGDQLIDDSSDFDLIIMGKKGIGNNLSNIFGSVTKRAIKSAQCPILLIPENAQMSTSLRILYPAKKRLTKLKNIDWILSEGHNEVHFVHYESLDNQHSPMIKEIFPSTNEFFGSDSEFTFKYINNRSNDVDQSILNYIDENEIDLVIFEKGKESFGEFILQRSVTNELVRKLDIPMAILNENLR